MLRTLDNVNLYGLRPRKKKTLFALRHKTARLNFAKEREKKPKEYRENILWSDETKINLFGSDGVQHVWCESGQDYHCECMVLMVKHGIGSVVIWGCMSVKHVGYDIYRWHYECLWIYQNTSWQDDSVNKLGRRGICQHDNDPKPNTAKTMQVFLSKEKSENYAKYVAWLASSRTNLGLLKREVEPHNPSSKEQLEKVISEEWLNISPEICTVLVSSMKRRIESVIKNKGSFEKIKFEFQ